MLHGVPERLRLVVAFFLFLLRPAPWVVGVIIAALAVLTFVPIVFVHPFRVVRLRVLSAVLLAIGGLSKVVAADSALPIAVTNTVVISTGLIDRLVVEARTNNPSLRAADSRARSASLNAQAVRTWEDPMALFGGSICRSPLNRISCPNSMVPTSNTLSEESNIDWT